MQFWLQLTLLMQSVLIGALVLYIFRLGRFAAGLPGEPKPPARVPKNESNHIQRILDAASRTLDEHAGELGRFEESFGTPTAKPQPQGPEFKKALEEMHQANQRVEETIDNTVACLVGACSEMLEDEKSQLEAYRIQTEAFDGNLQGVDRDTILAAIASKLVEMVRELQRENATVRNGLDSAKDKTIELMARAHSAEQMARTDSLTKLPNRRVFEEVHSEHHEAFERSEETYAIVLMDLDHFKSVNDLHGHQTGDAVLAMVGQVFADNRRTDDYLCRTGGEEFALLLTKCNLATAMIVADRYRQKIESASLRAGDLHVSVTISCGAAEVLAHESKGQLLKRADLALYRAKSLGRNRVCVDNGDGTFRSTKGLPTASRSSTRVQQPDDNAILAKTP
jgi:diguanylate cyclase (GGDEF)-like protein